jgi:hypothetical protein
MTSWYAKLARLARSGFFEIMQPAAAEPEVVAAEGRLVVAARSRVNVDERDQGVRFTAETAEPLSAEQVRSLVDQDRR